MSNHPKWITEHVPTEIAESTLFKFRFKLPQGETVSVDMLSDLDIDYDMLEEQMQTIPAQYAYWAALYSELRCAVAVYERKLKAKRGRLTETILQSSKENNIKLPEKTVAALVEKDENLEKLELELSILQMKSGKLYHMLEAMKMRSELIRSLGGFKRQERSES